MTVGATCVELIEARTRALPGAEAVYCEAGGAVSLAEVGARANRLAHHLRERCDVMPGEPVAVLLERTGWLVPAALGVLKSGGCYFPLSPQLPDERLALLLRDSGCRTVVAEPAWHARLGEGYTVVDPRAAAGADGDPEPRVGPGDAATLLYTSGSTGRPKGVVIEHHSLTNLLAALEPMLYAPLGGRAREALSAPVIFDAALQQMLSSLATGGTLLVVDEETRRDPHAFLAFVRRHEVQTINVVGSFLGALVDAGLDVRTPSSLRHVVTGGEAVSTAMVRRLLGGGAPLTVFSMYGPTEACVDTTCLKVDRETVLDGPQLALGEPLANVGVDVRDAALRPCAPGEIGEICVSGAGLARGYLHENGASGFLTVDGRRLYRTGDLGRVTADGTLEFAGRADDQVKVRGHRIELGEVEHALGAHPDVRQGAVIVVDGDLVACVVGDVDAAALRPFLAERLSPWAVPARFVTVAELPYLESGKLDRRTLAALVGSEGAAPAHGEAPRGPLERGLAAILAETLARSAIGRDEDFFALGGHSLKAMQAVNRIAARWGVVVPLRLLFEHPSVARLAAALEPLLRTAPAAVEIPRAPDAADYPLSRAQGRLWAVQQLDGGRAAYNVPVAMRQGRLDPAALERALATMAERHASLRTAFRVVDGEPRQVIAERVTIPLQRLDVSGAGEAEAAVLRDAERPFALDTAPLARATLIELGPDESWFVLVLNHLICDGWSIGVLSRELNRCYRGELAEAAPAVRYVDYAVWDSERDLTAAVAARAEALRGVPPWLELPTDVPRSAEPRRFAGATRGFELEREPADALRQVAAAHETTLASLLLALYAWLLHRITRAEDLCVGMGVAGRSHRGLEGLVGFFVNVVPVRVRVNPADELDALVREVTGAVRDALDAQDVPLEALVRELAPARRPDVQPLVNAMFAFQSFADAVPAGLSDDGALALEQSRLVDLPLPTAKFDLTLYVYEAGGGLRLAFEYDDALFTGATIERYLAAFERLAREVAAG